MSLVLDWKKKLGYRNDPFHTDIPRPVHRFLVGLDDLQEKFNLFLIKNHRVGMLSGEKGAGKTMFLRWVEESLRDRKYRAAYLSGRGRNVLEDLTHDGIFARFRKRTPDDRYKALLKRLRKRRYVFLVDDAGSLDKANTELLLDILDKTETHVLLADTPEKLKKIDLTDQLKAALPDYGHEQLVEILARRITAAGGSGTFPFEDSHLKGLTKKAKGSPAKLLELAREQAIELSLKVKRPPEQSQEQSGFLGIRIDRGEKPQVEEPPAGEAEKEPLSEEELAKLVNGRE